MVRGRVWVWKRVRERIRMGEKKRMDEGEERVRVLERERSGRW